MKASELIFNLHGFMIECGDVDVRIMVDDEPSTSIRIVEPTQDRSAIIVFD